MDNNSGVRKKDPVEAGLNKMKQERDATTECNRATAPIGDPSQEKLRNDYINSLNQWLWQCYHWQQVNSVVTSAMLHSMGNPTHGSTGLTDVNRNLVGGTPGGVQQTVDVQVLQVSIPTIPKRIAAELIDCAILLVAKFIITYIAVEYFEIIDLPSYDLRILQQDLLTYSVALETLLDKWPILFLESIHRLVVILYETLAIWGMIGKGQTIGKYLMNIRVINCSQYDTVAQGVLRVRLNSGVGFFWALLRATMKNCGITFLFPVCITALFFQHNRAVYDQLCRTLVIEEPRNGPRIIFNH